MGEPKITFGDRIFLYGQFLQYLYQFGDYEYNSVMGFMTIGGYIVKPIETDILGASIPGFVVEFLHNPSLTVETPFSSDGMIDVTDKLSKQTPSLTGSKVWMPTIELPQSRSSSW